MLTVADFMNTNVFFVNPDQTLLDAYVLMKESRARYLPVVDGFRVVGVLSISDIKLHASEQSGELIIPHKKISEVMARNIVTCNKYWSLEKAAKVMAKQGIGCLPVLHDGELIGMITARELLLGLTGEKEGWDSNRNLSDVESPWFPSSKTHTSLPSQAEGDFGVHAYL